MKISNKFILILIFSFAILITLNFDCESKYIYNHSEYKAYIDKYIDKIFINMEYPSIKYYMLYIVGPASSEGTIYRTQIVPNYNIEILDSNIVNFTLDTNITPERISIYKENLFIASFRRSTIAGDDSLSLWRDTSFKEKNYNYLDSNVLFLNNVVAYAFIKSDSLYILNSSCYDNDTIVNNYYQIFNLNNLLDIELLKKDIVKWQKDKSNIR